MGFWDSLKGHVGAQFLDVIQWQEDGHDTLVFRPPVFDQVIQDGGKLVVREGQSAVFQKEGQISDAFGPGTYELSTRTPAIWGFFQSIKYGLNNPYKGDVFFLNTRIQRDQKWGSPGPFPLRDKKFGLIKLRAFGTYSFRIADTVKFIREVVGNNGLFSADEINGDIKRRLFDKFKILAKAGGVSYEELDMQTDEIRAALVQKLGGELLADYGIQLTGFTILNVNVDPEDEKRIRRVEDIDVFDSRFDRYREMRQMDMMDTAVAREGSSNQMMDAGMGLAMGQMFGQQMGQQMGQSGGMASAPPATPQAAPPPMATTYHYNGVAGQGQFSAQQIAQHVASNRNGAHNVWAQGWPNWQGWQQVPEIANLVPPAPAAPPPMPGASSVVVFHYNEDGQNRGELPSNTIAQSIQANPTGKHLVWKNGMSNWTDAKEVPEIQAHAQSAPPPMPGAGGPPPMP